MNKTIKRKTAKPKGHRRTLYVRDLDEWEEFRRAAAKDRRSLSAWLAKQGRKAIKSDLSGSNCYTEESA